MIDIKLIREDGDAVEASLKGKDGTIDLSEIRTLDTDLRQAKTEVEHLKAERNESSKKIGELKRKGEDASDLLAAISGHAEKIHVLDQKIHELNEKLEDALAHLPNLPEEGTPIAESPDDNVLIKEWGTKSTFDFQPKNHLELNEQLHLLDFKRGAKLAGTGWPVYRGIGARLEWALLNYMIDFHLSNGWEFCLPPHLCRPEVLHASGQLPKFQGQFFEVIDDDYHLCLIPTAEVALNGLHREEIFAEEELPRKYIAYSPCFRREAGAAGSNERGLIRVHQFNKVEMFAFAKPDQSAAIFDEMLSSAEKLLEGLDLHYRSMLLVTGDMSFAAAKTVDVEVWLPGQDRYYEVSSVSNCTDFQARRSKTRYREKGGKPELLHTLNGSGLATARLMVAILENNQHADGSVDIPKALQKYLGGVERLEPTLAIAE
jgi:seryl-tRNA synthetase